ncbi:hypothetical protein [Tateyamaria pelophila]|uniref:hypothetical protein n=1 Tax=Tateyamaria pelophila TaxID=328415 RepID=UPI001CBD744C|nr:hypothetical protein [Tateyamaria pelophila]
MRLKAMIASLAICTASVAAAEEFTLEPTDFDGAFARVRDSATQGCWTNIGEATTYANDQMAIAGFEIVEARQKAEFVEAMIKDNTLIMTISVQARRLENGLCIGSIVTYMMGAVLSRKYPAWNYTTTIGQPMHWSVSSNDNLNHHVLDQIKRFVTGWVELHRTLVRLE